MNTQTKKSIKDAWLLAKLKCGDHKGIGKNRFEIANRLGFCEMNVFFDASTNRRDEGKHECWVDIYSDDDSSGSRNYTIKDLLDELNKFHHGQAVKLDFGYNIWNKRNDETIKSNTIFEKDFSI